MGGAVWHAVQWTVVLLLSLLVWFFWFTHNQHITVVVLHNNYNPPAALR